jgi:glucose 1-dehydrogenase
MGQLDGRVALITGGGEGIGRGLAAAFLKQGARVVIAEFNDALGQQTAKDLANLTRGEIVHITTDVTVKGQIQGAVAETVARFGTIDILVNNAGLQRDAAFHDMTLAQWNTVIGVNLTGQFLCAREAIREFLRRGVVAATSCAAGKIICMSSVHQVIPWAGHVNYAASKGGVMLMMQSLAQEVAPHRIRVNGIAPGAVRTPINAAAWQTPEAYQRLMTLVPYGRIGEPEDVARATVWLASDDADYVVGATLFIDGGMTLYPGFADNG